MVRRLHLYLTVLFFLICKFSDAQKSKMHVLSGEEAKAVKKDAATMYAIEDYYGALPAYLDLYNTDPKNVDYNYRLAYCYLMTSTNKRAALKHLVFALDAKDSKKEWLYFLGLAYMYNEKWDEAINSFQSFKESVKMKTTKDLLMPERLIEMCYNGKELSSKPVNCTFTNLGKNINSTFEEYNPFISADGNTLIFTSRRKGNMGGFIEDLGIYTSDIFAAFWRDTIWSKPRSVGANVNTEWDEESVGMNATADMLYVYFDNSTAYADLAVTSLKGKMWQKTELLPQEINTKQEEVGACQSPDGSTLYFSSNKKDGSGGKDIWMAKKENGVWSQAINLGNTINTQYDEISPYLSVDGKKLYFSSNGWNSMGGFDIFYSKWNEAEKAWGKPVNLGYPINDALDNKFISFTGDERYAYISAVRPGGLGNEDIYQIEFNDTIHHPFKKLIIGSVAGRVELTKIQLENKITGEVNLYQPSLNNQFAFSVKPGEYVLKVEGYKFAPYTEEISIGTEFPPLEIIKIVQVQLTK